MHDPGLQMHKMGMLIKHLLIIAHKEVHLELLKSYSTGQNAENKCGVLSTPNT